MSNGTVVLIVHMGVKPGELGRLRTPHHKVLVVNVFQFLQNLIKKIEKLKST